jgi:CorA-like Mg2+ transporter protein
MAAVSPDDSAALFESLLVAAADSIGEATQEIAGQLDQIEDRVLSDSLRDESAALLRLRRGISRQERLVHAAHSVLSQLEQNRAESVLQAYRDLGSRVRQRVDAFHADLHLQAERARLLQEELAAKLATATNRNLFALTVVTTVLLPPAFVTGYFGMNTKGLPFTDSEYGTVYATVLCLLAAGVVYLLIRRYRSVSWRRFAPRLSLSASRAASGASHRLKPGSHSGCAVFGDSRFEWPFARVVSDERDMGAAAGPDEDGIAPIGLSAVVHRVKEPRDVAPEPHCLNDRRFVDERKHGRLAAGDHVYRLGRPVDEGCAVDRKRR